MVQCTKFWYEKCNFWDLTHFQWPVTSWWRNLSDIFLHHKHSRDVLLSCHHCDVITSHLGNEWRHTFQTFHTFHRVPKLCSYQRFPSTHELEISGQAPLKLPYFKGLYKKNGWIRTLQLRANEPENTKLFVCKRWDVRIQQFFRYLKVEKLLNPLCFTVSFR